MQKSPLSRQQFYNRLLKDVRHKQNSPLMFPTEQHGTHSPYTFMLSKEQRYAHCEVFHLHGRLRMCAIYISTRDQRLMLTINATC
jgi:predicted N-formylglutamate amidohydrolase